MIQERARRLSLRAGLASAASGALVLIGWQTDMPVLKGIAAGLVPMNPATAVCFVLTGLSLAILMSKARGQGARNAAVGLALVVLALCAATLTGLALGHDLQLDQILYREKLNTVTGIPMSRMAPNTACIFILLGLGSIALRLEPRRAGAWAQGFGLASLFLTIPAVLGHAYGVASFYRVTSFFPMALITAITFLVLSLGFVVALPRRGFAALILRQDPSGMMLRRFLPLSALSIALIGSIVLRGQRLGLHDQEFGVCLFATLAILVIAVITVLSSVALGRIETARQAATEALRLAHAGLESRVEVRTAELQEANRELERQVERHRRAVEEIQSERRFSSQIVRSSADGIVAFDRGMRITAWNPAMERITGLPADRVLGRLAPEAFPFLTDIGEVATMEEALGGAPVTSRDRPFDIAETGRKGFFDSQLSPLLDEAGEIVGGVATVHETTGEKQLEVQLHQAQKMEAIGRLAGGVAHDFNNLLTAVMGYGQLMKAKFSAGDPALHDVEEILRAAARGASLTRQLLLFSRHQPVELQALDLNATITGMDKMLRRLVGEDVDLLTVTSPSPIHVWADAGQLEQVLMNLSVNARDAMPDGGRLTIEATTVDLDETYAEEHPGVTPGRYAMLAVTDTGTGIAPDVKAHVFEPFFTTKEVGKGTGLGLSTVHGIVSKSGGHVDVYSEWGRGTTFKVYWPLSEQPAVLAVPHAEDAAADGGHETLLVVEDEEPLRRIMCNVLALRGYKVLEAGDGSEAIGICERRHQPIDLLVTDVIMPLMNGPDLARRALKVRPGLRVLYTSGYTDRALVHQESRDGASDFLQKPFSPETLARKIRDILDRPLRSVA